MPCDHHGIVQSYVVLAFGLLDPELPQLGQLQEEIDSYDRMWALYDQFYSGLGELTHQDWLSFRCASACLCVHCSF